jgi:hypothetical protein
LRNTDLRCAGFEACDFTDADMAGAKLTRKQGERILLSDKQRKVIDWQDSEGEEQGQPPPNDRSNVSVLGFLPFGIENAWTGGVPQRGR